MSIPEDDHLGPPKYPAPWTTSMPREGLRDTDQARIISLAPDVCKSPTVPVPYPVVEFCGHDENYTPSVRFTGQKAMVMRSNTSHVHGDEAGVGKGVKSGTVGGISEPITHAAQVRAEGSHVIRYLDRFWMNNRNTMGEALFVRNTTTYPAPVDDDPLPGSLVRIADASPGWVNFVDLPPAGEPALAPPSTSLPPTGDLPVPTSSPLPPSQNPEPGGGSPLWNGVKWVARKNWAIRLGVEIVEGSRRDDQLAWNDPESYMAREAEAKGGLDSFDPMERQIHEDAIVRLRNGDSPKDVRTDYENQISDYRNTMKTDELLHPEDAPARPGSDTVRVSEVEDYRKRCEVARYGRMRNICGKYGMQAHHIVPDWTLRYGSRTSSERIPNMPSLADGMAICVVGHASKNDTEHSRAHFADKAIEGLGESSTPPFTATLKDVKEASIRAMVRVRKDCAPQILAAVNGQFADKNPSQLLRAKRLPPLPVETTSALLRSGIKNLP